MSIETGKVRAESTTRDLAKLTALEMIEGFREGYFDPVDVFEDTKAALCRADERLNVMVTDLFESAKLAAETAARAWRVGEARALEGVPVTIKDLVFVADAPCKGGAPSFENHVPSADAYVVEKLRCVGAVLTCKTTTCESGYKLTADSPVSGITRNPWNSDRTSGGSSGGAAAAVAAGAGPLAIGTDGVGSIRVPASFCGVAGIKPTYGRVSRAPGFSPPSWGSLAHTGPIGRSVDDIALMLEIIAGYDMRDPASLFGVNHGEKQQNEPLSFARSVDFGYAPVAASVRAAFENACIVLETLGFAASGECITLPRDVLETTLKPIAITEQAASVGERTDAAFAASDADFRSVLAHGKTYSGVDYVEATHLRNRLRAQFVALFQNVDFLVTPTLPITAFDAGTLGVAEIDGHAVDPHLGWSPFTWPLNLTGLPAATIPCGQCNDGLPIGLQIVAPWGQEGRILAVAKAFEQKCPPRSVAG